MEMGKGDNTFLNEGCAEMSTRSIYFLVQIRAHFE